MNRRFGPFARFSHALVAELLERHGERAVGLLLGLIAAYWIALVLVAWRSGAIQRLVAR